MGRRAGALIGIGISCVSYERVGVPNRKIFKPGHHIIPLLPGTTVDCQRQGVVPCTWCAYDTAFGTARCMGLWPTNIATVRGRSQPRRQMWDGSPAAGTAVVQVDTFVQVWVCRHREMGCVALPHSGVSNESILRVTLLRRLDGLEGLF